MATTIALKFSSLTFGTDEFGYISREDCHDAEEEDQRYQRHVRTKTGDATWQVFDGVLYKK